MYSAQNGIYIGLDKETLSNLEEKGLIRLNLNGDTIVIHLREFDEPENTARDEAQPGVA